MLELTASHISDFFQADAVRPRGAAQSIACNHNGGRRTSSKTDSCSRRSKLSKITVTISTRPLIEDSSSIGFKSEDRRMDGAKMRARLDMLILFDCAWTATSVKNCIRCNSVLRCSRGMATIAAWTKRIVHQARSKPDQQRMQGNSHKHALERK